MDDVLIHHGILGQKWGIRRYQNADGSYTAEGKKRYSSSKDTYGALARRNAKSNGTTEEEERKRIDAYRENIKKLALAGGAVVLASGCVYAAVKLKPAIEANRDQTLKKGSKIYRMAEGDTDALKDTFYATPDKADADVYKNQLGVGHNGYKYQKEYLAKSDVKIAGMKNSEKEFKKLLKSDPDFKKAVESLGHDYKNYKTFNTYAPLQRGDNAKAFSTFQKHMESKGYGGIVDYNDKAGSGFGTKNPVIFFGGNKNYRTYNVHKVNAKEMADAKYAVNAIVNRNKNKQTLEAVTKTTATYGAEAVGVSLASLGLIKVSAISESKKEAKEESKNE